MAKKKTRKTRVKKPTLKIETRFDCPICNHENVVQCKMNTKLNRGTAFCNVCQANYGCKITDIDNAIDVYSSWIDEIHNRG